ncbi:MAG: hypothetical protein LBB76_03435 [Azoarcus sp.]|nr:hypothetical protein [Azoarcus sp.]
MKTSIRKKSVTAPFPLRARALTYAIAMAFSVPASVAAAADLNISQVPLVAGVGVPANLLYIHDDSGSMTWSYMPDTAFTTSVQYKDPNYNSQYYSPGTPYKAPPFTDDAHTDPEGKDATFNNAWTNGYDPARDSVSEYNGLNNYNSSVVPCSSFTWDYNDFDGYYFGSPPYYLNTPTLSGSEMKLPGKVNLSTSYKATLAEPSVYGCQQTYWGNYLRGVGYGTSYTGNINPDAAHYYSGNTRVYISPAEQQNFANWYSYYRTREMAAKAGIALAFSKIPNLGDNSIRVGWGRINKTSTQTIDGKTVPVIIQGVRPFSGSGVAGAAYGGGHRADFFTWLYGLNSSGGTPLLGALNAAGQYYDRSSGSLGPWADDPEHPGNLADEKDAVCRKSFTILMTDGYYGDTISSVGNADGVATTFSPPPQPGGGTPPTWNKQPYSDTNSNTLADIAWSYWVKDLSPADNKVPPYEPRDPAWWQHMTTYTVGMGVAGSIPDKSVPFGIADAHTTSGSAGYTWPDLSGVTASSSDPKKIDDLLHAGVNGHGDFFSAKSANEFVDAMEKILNSIKSSAGGSGNLAKNSGKAGAAGVYVFNTTYDANWNGKLTASRFLTINTSNPSAVGDVAWEASEQMPGAAARNIYTRAALLKTVASGGVAFNSLGSLSTWQQSYLNQSQPAPHGDNVLKYLRGDATNEAPNGERFRVRLHVGTRAALGDSVNTTPIYDDETKTLYQGANDGMLHAFNAETGVERFAYIPTGIFHKLNQLPDSAYSHQYYVDGDVNITTLGSSRYLVGVLGRGGTGAYGLDVTHPGSFGTGSVKWELNGRIDKANCGNSTTVDEGTEEDLGFIIGQPMIARINATDGVAIVGNGYNSCDDKAVLYVINVKTGAIQQRIEAGTALSGVNNGLSAPYWLDADRDEHLSTGDVVYAGDLRGNLWRFEYNGSGFGAAGLLFTAHNATGEVQPITAAPQAILHPGTSDTYVFVGTGQFLQQEDKDPDSFRVQSWYGLKDTGSTISRSDLITRTITSGTELATLSDGSEVPVRFVSPATAGDMESVQGWHIDLNIAADAGERITTPSVTFSVGSGPDKMVLMVSSLIPSDDKCSGGGRGYANFVNPFTGAELEYPIADINGDGKVDATDRLSGHVVASLGLDGIPGKMIVPGGRDGTDTDKGDGGGCAGPIVIGTSTGKTYSTATVNYCPGIKGRLSWREIVE